MKRNRSGAHGSGPPREWVGTSENRSGLPGEIGQNKSGLVKTGSQFGQFGQNGPSEHKIPGEEASKSR